MDKIPESAAVNESVTLAKHYCKKQRSAPGLVNAVLRNAVRNMESIQQPTGWQEIYSHPQALIDLLKSYVGKERIKPMLESNNAAPQTVIQVNTLKITTEALMKRLEEERVEAQPHGWMRDCLVLGSTGNLEHLPSFKEGLFYIQDAAAKLSVLCAQLPKDANVLDCCAAPGGKSFAAAIAMAGTGTITSCDVYEHKANLIAGGAQRLGITNLTAQCLDATTHVEAWEGKMDAVIADVPCSGLGIIRKKPDIRYKKLEQMAELPELQLQILNNVSTYVRSGGVLLYSTCTLVWEENEGVVERFLKEHQEFSLEPLPLPQAFPENTTGMLALIPGQHDTDGFFIAKLRRNL
jgi:16S rRNA (cytosine967-C5)-methyltransferase